MPGTMALLVSGDVGFFSAAGKLRERLPAVRRGNTRAGIVQYAVYVRGNAVFPTKICVLRVCTVAQEIFSVP